tara:strand:- start:22214 stop:22423 length:210 start_codon:yes stop_codon:yes gene_type:complete
MLKRESQKDAVLRSLKSGFPMTPVDAMNDPEIRSMRLAAIIHDLRDEGYTIINKNRKGKKRFAEYRLIP